MPLDANDLELIQKIVGERLALNRNAEKVQAIVIVGGEPGVEIQVGTITAPTKPVFVMNLTGVSLAAGDTVQIESLSDGSGNAVHGVGESASIYETGDILSSLRSTKAGWLKLGGVAIPQDDSTAALRVLLAGLSMSTTVTPDWKDYVLAQAGGTMIPLVGGIAGETSHAIVKAEMPNYDLTVIESTHLHAIGSGVNVSTAGTDRQEPGPSGTALSGGATTGLRVNTGGSNQPLSLVQKSAGVNLFVKL